MSGTIEEDAGAKGVFWASVDGRRLLATRNLAPGFSLYGERLIPFGGAEYRLWDARRSKLAAAFLLGLGAMPISPGSRVLYLGASTGTTVSHVSDMVGQGGTVFAVEVSPRVARELVEHVARHRRNVIPVVEDARNCSRYGVVYGRIDVLYCDIAQSDQTPIALANAQRYLAPAGHMLLVVKARSIDVLKEPKVVVAEEAEKVRRAGLQVMKAISLEPYDRDHGMILARK